MDLATHALMGAVLAAPWAERSPLTASCLIVGSVLPDLDTFAILWGRRAFLQIHQSYSHGLPSLLLIAFGAGCYFQCQGISPWEPAAALFAGLLLHVMTDLTNSYGVQFWAPFSTRRICLDWVFFLDIVVFLSSLLAAVLIYFGPEFDFTGRLILSSLYLGFLSMYWGTRYALRLRAQRLALAGTKLLIPSGLLPWYFFGYLRQGDQVTLYRLNALTGSVEARRNLRIFDSHYQDRLEQIPEFRVMRNLSPAYHVIAVEPHAPGTRVTCLDLRIQNLNTRFCELHVLFNQHGSIAKVQFFV